MKPLSPSRLRLEHLHHHIGHPPQLLDLDGRIRRLAAETQMQDELGRFVDRFERPADLLQGADPAVRVDELADAANCALEGREPVDRIHPNQPLPAGVTLRVLVADRRRASTVCANPHDTGSV